MYSKKTECLFVSMLFSVGLPFFSPAQAAGFIDDSAVTGGIYYWQRHRERKEINPVAGESPYQQNLHHSTSNSNIDFSSGYFSDFIGLDLALFGAVEFSGKGPAAPNEIAFSDAKTRWGEKWTGDKNGMSLYKAALKLKHDNFWLRGGYIQPSGYSLLASHWSFMPGTWRGVETGADYDFSGDGKLSLSWMWSDKYKAPWYRNMYNFRKADGKSDIKYLHSFGVKYDFKNALIMEGAFGQAASYVDQYFAKVSYSFPVADNKLNASWQFYGANDKVNEQSVNDIYDGLVWLQGATLGYSSGPFDFRLEGTWVKAPGKQGYFLQRMTPGYATSNGRLDIWWDSRSDFNADGEKAVFAGVMVDLSTWRLPGWSVGTSVAYGWNAKPADTAPHSRQRLKESAWNLDLLCQIQSGWAKDTLFKLHYTRYDNHSDLPSWSGGYGNIFQDERDIKFMMIAPFTLY